MAESVKSYAFPLKKYYNVINDNLTSYMIGLDVKSILIDSSIYEWISNFVKAVNRLKRL